MSEEVEVPRAQEIEEAKRVPNGYVYRIAGKFETNQRVPPEAINGAWRVDSAGRITGQFVKNQKYDPKKWPVQLSTRSTGKESDKV